MVNTTRDAMKAIMLTDPTIRAEEMKAALAVLSGKRVSTRLCTVEAQVLSRDEVARMCHIHPKRVDEYSRRGVFKRVYFPGAKRAAGILRSSAESALASAVFA